MKIVAGLGNPGPRYRNSRHNLGFLVLDRLAERLGVRLDREKHQGLVAEADWRGERLLLVKPMTYMNRSGDCLARFARNTLQRPDDLLAVVDDVDLPLGKMRMRRGGSAGGHNGLKSIIERLGTQDFPRLRLGIGQQRRDAELADYVLGRFHPDELPEVRRLEEAAPDAILCWVEHGAEQVMNEYNR